MNAGTQSTLNTLVEESVTITHLRKVAAVLNWDRETYMPASSGAARADQISLILSLAHSRFTGSDFQKSLGQLVDLETGKVIAAGLNDDHEKLVSLVWYDWHRARVLPVDFIGDLARLTSESQGVWQLAREKDRFDLFAPYLEKIVVMKRQEADYLGYEDEPYNALLENYEPGVTSAQLVALFSELKPVLVDLTKRIAESGMDDHAEILSQQYDKNEQLEFGLTILRDMGYDMNRGRQDISAHPFTTDFHPTDVRITTRLASDQLAMGLFGSIHEGGHALYEQGLNADHFGTPLCEAVSLGLHESQSRLWEMYVAKDMPFWKFYYPRLQSTFRSQLGDITIDDFYRAINSVVPSHIRVEADEVTYNLHIMLRFDLERGLLNGDIAVKDLPTVWRERMIDYLGIAPPTDTDGVLQDIHWSLGAFGYFPTYTLGNLYGRQIFEAARDQINKFDERIAGGDLKTVREWLRQNVHRHGRRHTAEEMIMSISGEALSAKPFITYLMRKYGDLYQLNLKD